MEEMLRNGAEVDEVTRKKCNQMIRKQKLKNLKDV